MLVSGVSPYLLSLAGFQDVPHPVSIHKVRGVCAVRWWKCWLQSAQQLRQCPGPQGPPRNGAAPAATPLHTAAPMALCGPLYTFVFCTLLAFDGVGVGP